MANDPAAELAYTRLDLRPLYVAGLECEEVVAISNASTTFRQVCAARSWGKAAIGFVRRTVVAM